MDLADIRRAANAAREYTQPFSDGQGTEITFTLRVPSSHELDCLTAAHSLRTRIEAVVRSRRATLEAAIVGWSGAKVGDVLRGHKHGTEEFLFEPGAAVTLLDERPDVAEALWAPLERRLEERATQAEATAKNSPRASTGSKAKTVRAS